jgi:hypothetical protein
LCCTDCHQIISTSSANLPANPTTWRELWSSCIPRTIPKAQSKPCE